MRDKYRMQLRNFLTEMPIVGWNYAPDMDEREAEMKSKFRGYSQEQLHYSPADKRAIANPQKIMKAFSRVPYRFNIYFWQMSNPDYDPYLQKGESSLEWLAEHRIDFSPFYQSDSINIVITNNLSDEHKFSFTSPWIFAHRVGHALSGKSFDLSLIFEQFCERILPLAYDGYWPSEDGYGYYMRKEYKEIYTLVFGHHLGTMSSAKNGNLVNGSEWAMETFAQYLITGGVRLNPLPDQISDDEKLTHDPRKLVKIDHLMKEFPKTIMRKFDRILNRSVGKIFVV